MSVHVNDSTLARVRVCVCVKNSEHLGFGPLSHNFTMENFWMFQIDHSDHDDKDDLLPRNEV